MKIPSLVASSMLAKACLHVLVSMLPLKDAEDDHNNKNTFKHNFVKSIKKFDAHQPVEFSIKKAALLLWIVGRSSQRHCEQVTLWHFIQTYHWDKWYLPVELRAGGHSVAFILSVMALLKTSGNRKRERERPKICLDSQLLWQSIRKDFRKWNRPFRDNVRQKLQDTDYFVTRFLCHLWGRFELIRFSNTLRLSSSIVIFELPHWV